MSSVRPEYDSAFWEALAMRPWKRARWHRTDGSPASETCFAYGKPLHRKGTYYLRPAYTDGKVWLCQQAYDEMIEWVEGHRASRARPRPSEE
ncbi:MAG: hypothetical protein IIC18_02785 [Bacteroidetes bacterium]|nr:hypothetical protein [Bacteroidota bacterium]MCH8030389.1 hypothetical protein [Bacteroidota bacterium]